MSQSRKCPTRQFQTLVPSTAILPSLKKALYDTLSVSGFSEGLAGLSPLHLANRRLDLMVCQRHGSAHAGLWDPGQVRAIKIIALLQKVNCYWCWAMWFMYLAAFGRDYLYLLAWNKQNIYRTQITWQVRRSKREQSDCIQLNVCPFCIDYQWFFFQDIAVLVHQTLMLSGHCRGLHAWRILPLGLHRVGGGSHKSFYQWEDNITPTKTLTWSHTQKRVSGVIHQFDMQVSKPGPMTICQYAVAVV